jgi:hypothetical protein
LHWLSKKMPFYCLPLCRSVNYDLMTAVFTGVASALEQQECVGLD